MTDQELLQAIGQIVEAKMEPLCQDVRIIKEDVQELKVRMDSLEYRMDSLEHRMDSLEHRMDSLECRMDTLEQRIDALERRMDALERRIDALEQRVGTLEEQMAGVRVYIDVDLRRTLNLLLEGQQALWDRFATREDVESLEIRTSALEMAVKQHSQEIQELKLA